MKKIHGLRLALIGALGAGGATLLVWWLLTRAGVPTIEHGLWAAAAALSAAALAGLALQATTLRRLAQWRAEIDSLSERLVSLDQDGRSALADDPGVALGELSSFQDAGTEDDSLDDALTALVAALEDEERLRERRETAGDDVRRTLRRADELGGKRSKDEHDLARLPALLVGFEKSVEGILAVAEIIHQHGIACEEIASLVAENVEHEQEACKRATANAHESDQHLTCSLQVAQRLETRSREIGQVLTVINDITEQTNLLALNAAIIAAQAGEEGKGFGVVADEMRNLSERASSSTKETEILAESLQEEVARAVADLRTAERVTDRLRENLARAGETASVLGDLGKKNTAAARRTAGRAEEQARGVRDLAGTLRQLADERRRLLRLETETLTPLRTVLGEMSGILETQWQMGAVRESLRKRLEGAVQTIRQRRGRERQQRQRLYEKIRVLRDSGRTWSAALADGQRRERVIQEISREARRISSTTIER